MHSGGERVTRQLRALLATVVCPGSGRLAPPSFLFECRPHKAYCVHLQAGSHPTLNPDTREIKKQESSLLFLFPELSLTLPTPTAHMSLGGPWDAVTPIPPPPMPPPHAGIHVAGWAIKPQWSWSVHPVRDAPSSSARHCILCSYPVPFACVLEYFLSDQAICLILLLKEWTLLRRGREIQSMLAAHMASLTLSVRSSKMIPFWHLQRNRFGKSVPGRRAFTLTLD